MGVPPPQRTRSSGFHSLAPPSTGHAHANRNKIATNRNHLTGKGTSIPALSSHQVSVAGSFLSKPSLPQSKSLGADTLGFHSNFEAISKGGGAFRPIGTNGQASFNVHPINGTLNVSIPIHTSPARAGFGPTLSLSYDSGSGNGVFGMGWQLSVDGASVSRKTGKGIPRYQDQDGSGFANEVDGDTDGDEFIFGGSDLVPTLDSEGNEISIQSVGGFRVTRYRPRLDVQSVRIEKWTSLVDESDVHWRSISSDNVVSIYGETDDSRVMDLDAVGRSRRIFSWLLTRSFDASGNAVMNVYKSEDGVKLFPGGVKPMWEQHRSKEERCRQKYLKRILYANTVPARDLETWNYRPVESWKDLGWLFEVVMDYGEHDALVPRSTEDTPWSVREDPFSTGNSGFEVRTYRLCRRFLMFHRFPKEPGHPGEALVSSTRLGYKETKQGTFLVSATAMGHMIDDLHKPSGAVASYKTESFPPTTLTYTTAPDLRQIKAFRANVVNLADMPRPGSLAEWIDLEGEGIPGLLTRSGDGHLVYQRNNGDTTFGTPEILSQQPSLATGFFGGFSDLDRNGRLNLVCIDTDGQQQGFYERDCDSETWSEYSEFPQTPVSEPREEVISIDLTGEGITDLLLDQGDAGHGLIWQKSLGKQGVSGQRRADSLHGDSEAHVTFVADMTGDGLSDIVHIGSTGKITYFPNRGYGSFGSPVEMGSPPIIESMDPARIRFIDVDGSGPTDLIYILPMGGIHIYFNQAGNSWTAPLLVSRLPRIIDPSSVFVLDLLGQGTACLCWHNAAGRDGPATSEIKYIDLMGGVKPHLLQSYENGTGVMTSVAYTPSIKLYLKDRAAGSPWTTRLPFPVQCVTQLITRDSITNNTSTTEYSYHNGCYDGVEKTFAGFEMVETWVRANIPLGEEGVYQAPTLYTRSWFHVGLKLLPDQTAFCTPSNVSSSIEALEGDQAFTQEALIALRGKLLRVETYGLDGSPKDHLPYAVEECSYDVRQLQHRLDGKTKHPVFQVMPRAALTTDYGRSVEDGRMVHEVVLSTTSWGEVARSLSIVYPRQPKHMTGISYSDVKKSQRAGQVFMTDYCFTNAILDEVFPEKRAFRRPLCWQQQMFEVPGFSFRESIFDIDVLRNADSEKWSKTLLSESRVLFKNSALNDTLDFGKIETFSVLEQSFNLAFTPELVTSLATGQQRSGITPLTAPDLMVDKVLAETGLVQLKGDGNWWLPSSCHYFTDSGTPHQELASARRSFYQATVSMDVFNSRSKLRMDRYNLMVEETQDALGNTITFTNDYRTLQPFRVTDENQNTQSVLCGPLGDVITTAVLGKLTAANVSDEVDSLDDFDTTVSETDIQSVLSDPNGPVACRLLGSAGSRTIRVLDAFVKTQKPNFTINITRERSFRVPGTPKLHVAVTYLQGAGEVLQTATLEECGLPSSSDTKWLMSGFEATAPVRMFEPFFACTPAFVPVNDCHSNASTNFHDARGACVAQLASDHSWTKTIYTPWKVVHWHEGDTLPLTDPKADPDVGHYFSHIAPSRYLPTWLDLQQKQDNETENRSAIEMAITQSRVYISQTPRTTFLGCHPAAPQIRSIHQAGDGIMMTEAFEYDAAGNQTHSWDNLGRLVETALYDKLGRPIQVRGMDKGDQWSISDAAGTPILSWNSRGICYHYKYDALRRETECWLTVMPTSSISTEQVNGQLVVETQYGETNEDAIQSNLRGRVWKVRDQAGEHTQFAFDVRGRCIRSGFQAAVEYKAVIGWKKQENTQLDESRRFQSVVKFDDLGQAVWDVDVQGNETRRVFSRRGHASKVELRHVSNQPDQWQTYLMDAVFDATGLPLSKTYGNGTRTTYIYHPESRHLLGQRTVVLKSQSSKLQAARQDVKEDLSFVYDIAGHRVFKSNKADKPVFVGNARIGADFTYSYDGMGQLTSATGRGRLPAAATQVQPHSALNGSPERSGPTEGDRPYNYRESYTYDLAGNMTRMRHEALGGASISGWTRRFYYEEPSLLSDDVRVMGNKLSRTTVGKKQQRYVSQSDPDDDEWAEGRTNDIETDGTNNNLSRLHDAGKVGCMTSLPGFALLRWNEENRLAAASTQRVGDDSIPTTTYYVYSSSGKRVRKVTEAAARDTGGNPFPRKQRETFFLGGTELKILYSGQVSQRWVAQVEDGSGGRIAFIETGASKSSSVHLVRYQIGDNLELDEQGRLISYEEYTPFGSPIFATTGREIQARREYRFARYRWDRETGFFACGARYYCPWLGRWTAPDPMGDVDGPNLFVYVGNDPINFQDPLGTSRSPERENKYSDPITLSVTREYDLLHRSKILTIQDLIQVNLSEHKVSRPAKAYSENYMKPTKQFRAQNLAPNLQPTNPNSKVFSQKIKAMDKKQTKALSGVNSKINPGKINEVPNMTNEQKSGMTLINKDVALSPRSREFIEKIFSQQYTNLTNLSQKLSNNSSGTDTKSNSIHQANIEEPLSELKHLQLFANLPPEKRDYQDGNRFELMDKLVSAMKDFADNNLDPNATGNTQIRSDIETVDTLHGILFEAWGIVVNGQENEAAVDSITKVAIVTEKVEQIRPNLRLELPKKK
ncbi:uncharacterized protein N7483_010726 [Penicillium malachiteum]|uniref:uncharacterized protein n=1 Tax=Penicillium malachiteum TaxID=1324776 RepID=UPI002547722C|nr:uncharacterized protein N7483_010726 [Penicillium malachiteum]KAJ5713545.1 hypothetical protein N7483_010726 [Penicillium malachiteum]